MENFQLRDVFNAKVVEELSEKILQVWPEFNQQKFLETIIPKLAPLSFGERNALIIHALELTLPAHFATAVDILLRSLPQEIENDELVGFDRFFVMSLCGYVRRNGQHNYDLSMHAFYELTKRFTAEGDIRPFIQKHTEKTLNIFKNWAKDPNCHVRRLVSESTRSRLPLCGRLPEFQKNPKPVLELLELLKEDPVLYVRRSVANNLNDIAKDNPEIVVATLKRWAKIDNSGTQWLVQHASRTLLKQGNSDALALLGFQSEIKIEVKNLKIEPENIFIGETLFFSFDVISKAEKVQNLMIDYIIHFQKANGTQAPKVFKLKKIAVKKGEIVKIRGKRSFAIISTRVLHAGAHAFELQINGNQFGKIPFELGQ